ncbi:MAG TPA: FAD:protein FMN transferase [Candidatus Omnitrophota bacterium]|nr:FAD:protein FMN transferase [Candidatus Omnitrophota bacterium]
MPKRRWWARAGLVLLISAALFGCFPPGVSRFEKYSEVRQLMGTMVQLDVCRDGLAQQKIDEAYRDVWASLEQVSWRMNVFDDRSDAAKINNSNLQPVFVGADTYHVIKKAIQFSQATGGAFDVTVWPLIEFWRQNEARNIFPSPEAVHAALAGIGSQNIRMLDDGRIQLLRNDTKIDLGGIAAGYAADEAARIFRGHGILNFFIDAGGDIYAGGLNCSGQPWRVGIRDPRDASKLIDVVALTDFAVTTSGDYEKYYTIRGQTWSHIINPVTGYPQRGVVSATVIAPTTMEADVLATALCVMGERAGTAHIDRLDGRYASIIFSAGKRQTITKLESQEYKNFRYKK